MIILFTLDGENIELKFPLSCDASITIRQAVAALRAKLRASASVTVDVRTHQGMPVPLTDSVGAVKERLFAKDSKSAATRKSYVELYALLDGPSKAVKQCLLAAARDRKQENPGVSEDVGSSSEEDVEEDDRRFTSDEDPRLKTPSAIPGLHFIRINGKFQKGYALSDVAWGGPITTEVPIMSLAYATQMAEAVHSNEKMRSRTYDPSMVAGESPLRGVDNDDFSKYVSIAKTYGHLLKTSDKYGAHMALYPEISCLRHCCTPNSVFRRAIVKPFRGIVRCAQPSGLMAGDEVTVLLPKVNTLIFMLLPRERRVRLIQERYHFTCDCARCWKGDDELELTLSGAFFNGEAKTNTNLQKKLTNEMREEFENLHIFNTKDGGVVDTPVGAKIPKSPHALLQFVTKYTAAAAPLRLHKNHWRVSVARIAYLKQAAFVLCAQNKEKTVPVRPFLEQRSFELALQQLSTECLFVPKGHPYYTNSFSIYKKMMNILPTNLVAALQAKSRKYPIEWESLNASLHLWEGAKGATAAGADLSGATTATAPKRRPPAKKAASAASATKATARKHDGPNADNDALNSSFSSDGEPVIPDAMKQQYRELYGDEAVDVSTHQNDPIDHDDEENEANVQPFKSQNKNRENIFAAEERAAEERAAEEAAFLAEHADEVEEDE